MKNGPMYLSTSSKNSHIGASLTPSFVEPVESDSNINLKAFIVQSSPILCYILLCNLYLKHHLGEENSLSHRITEKARLSVTCILLIDTC